MVEAKILLLKHILKVTYTAKGKLAYCAASSACAAIEVGIEFVFDEPGQAVAAAGVVYFGGKRGVVLTHQTPLSVWRTAKAATHKQR